MALRINGEKTGTSLLKISTMEGVAIGYEQVLSRHVAVGDRNPKHFSLKYSSIA